MSKHEHDPRLCSSHHKARHEALHAALDELVADWMVHNPAKLPSASTVLELVEWSHEQTKNPTELERE